MNKSESKYFNTAQIMDNALIDLLDKKDFEYITVKELCNTAGVNRSTFYLHYESMNDLLDEAIEMINKMFDESFDISINDMMLNIANAPLSDLVLINDSYLIPYLEFMKSNKKIFMAAQRNPHSMKTYTNFADICEKILIPIYKRFNIPENEHEYLIAFYFQGLKSVINHWIENDCKESVEEISKIIFNCVRPNLPNSAKEQL